MTKAQVIKEPNALVRYYREEAFRLTWIVLSVITVMAAILGTADYVFTQAVRVLIGI